MVDARQPPAPSVNACTRSRWTTSRRPRRPLTSWRVRCGASWVTPSPEQSSTREQPRRPTRAVPRPDQRDARTGGEGRLPEGSRTATYTILALLDGVGFAPVTLIARAALPGAEPRTVFDRLVKLYRHGRSRGTRPALHGHSSNDGKPPLLHSLTRRGLQVAVARARIGVSPPNASGSASSSPRGRWLTISTRSAGRSSSTACGDAATDRWRTPTGRYPVPQVGQGQRRHPITLNEIPVADGQAIIDVELKDVHGDQTRPLARAPDRDPELEREVGLDLGERLQLEVDDRLAVRDLDLADRDWVATLPGAGLRHGVAAGGVAGGAPAVGGDVRRRVRWNSIAQPSACRSCASRPARGLLDRPPLSLGRDRRRGLAFLGDLEPAARERVEHRRFAVGSGACRAGRWCGGRSGRGGRA